MQAQGWLTSRGSSACIPPLTLLPANGPPTPPLELAPAPNSPEEHLPENPNEQQELTPPQQQELQPDETQPLADTELSAQENKKESRNRSRVPLRRSTDSQYALLDEESRRNILQSRRYENRHTCYDNELPPPVLGFDFAEDSDEEDSPVLALEDTRVNHPEYFPFKSAVYGPSRPKQRPASEFSRRNGVDDNSSQPLLVGSNRGQRPAPLPASFISSSFQSGSGFGWKKKQRKKEKKEQEEKEKEKERGAETVWASVNDLGFPEQESKKSRKERREEKKNRKKEEALKKEGVPFRIYKEGAPALQAGVAGEGLRAIVDENKKGSTINQPEQPGGGGFSKLITAKGKVFATHSPSPSHHNRNNTTSLSCTVVGELRQLTANTLSYRIDKTKRFIANAETDDSDPPLFCYSRRELYFQQLTHCKHTPFRILESLCE